MVLLEINCERSIMLIMIIVMMITAMTLTMTTTIAMAAVNKSNVVARLALH